MTLALAFEKIELLPPGTQCYQVEDGTIFYFKEAVPQRLYVKIDGKIVEAPLPEAGGTIERVIAHGNELYFSTARRKIYEAITTPTSIEIAVVRTLNVCEHIDVSATFSRLQSGQKYFFKMCEDPIFQEGVLTNPIDQMCAGILKGIHRRKLIYLKCGLGGEMIKTVEKLGGKAIGITLSVSARDATLYAQDSSKFIFITHGPNIYTINTERMESEAPFCVGGVSNIAIVGIVGGVLTVSGKDMQGNNCLITTKVPDEASFLREYFEVSKVVSPSNGKSKPGSAKALHEHYREPLRRIQKSQSPPPAVAHPFDTVPPPFREEDMDEERRRERERQNKIKEREAQYIRQEKAKKQVADNNYMDEFLTKRPVEQWQEKVNKRVAEDSWRDEYLMKRNKKEDDINDTVNELLDKNCELTEQIRKLEKDSGSGRDDCRELHDRISEMETKNELVEEENAEVNKNLQRTLTLNEELDTANDQLTEERDELIKQRVEREREMTSLIANLREKKAKLAIEKERRRKVAEEKKELKALLESMLKENEELSKALTGKNIAGSKTVLAQNVQMMKELSI